MTDLFESMGLEDVEADINFIPDGVYPAFVFESTVVVAKNGKNAGKPFWAITYKIAEGTCKGRSQQEWFSLDPQNEQVKPWLKRRILSLGVPDSKVGSFKPDDVVGSSVAVTIKTKDGYQNVRDVKSNDVDAVTSTPASTNSLM